MLNLIVAIIGATAGAPADVVGGKFSGALMLGAIGGVLCYNGSKKKDKKENDKM